MWGVVPAHRPVVAGTPTTAAGMPLLAPSTAGQGLAQRAGQAPGGGSPDGGTFLTDGALTALLKGFDHLGDIGSGDS